MKFGTLSLYSRVCWRRSTSMMTILSACCGTPLCCSPAYQPCGRLRAPGRDRGWGQTGVKALWRTSPWKCYTGGMNWSARPWVTDEGCLSGHTHSPGNSELNTHTKKGGFPFSWVKHDKKGCFDFSVSSGNQEKWKLVVWWNRECTYSDKHTCLNPALSNHWKPRECGTLIYPAT